MKTIICKTCRATLLVSAERLPVCGRCGGDVEEAKSAIAKIQSKRRRKIAIWFMVSIATVGAGAMVIRLRDAISVQLLSIFDLMRSIRGSLIERPLAFIALFVVVAGSGLWIVHRLRARPRRRSASAKLLEPRGANLKEKIERLAMQAWGGREDIISNVLVLRPETLSKLISPTEFVGALLKHVGKIAPNLSVPRMTPRILNERLCDAAGQFVEQDGWVKIAVNSHFFDDQAAAYAIFATSSVIMFWERTEFEKS